MWVKVNVTEDGKLIRESDEQQIGELLVPVCYSAELSIYEVNGKETHAHHGYIGCSLECLNKRNPDCRYCLKGEEAQGLYINVPEEKDYMQIALENCEAYSKEIQGYFDR